MKNLSKNNSGFTIVEVLLVVLTLAIIGVAGYFVAKHVDNSKVSINNKSSKSSNDQSVIKIPELGVELTVPSTLSNLTYVTTPVSSFGVPSSSGITAHLSTTNLDSLDSACTPESSDYSSTNGYDGPAPLGDLARINGTFPTNPSDSSGGLELQGNGFYIAFQDSQSACSSKQSADTLQQTEKLALDKVLGALNPTAVQLIQ